MKPEKFFDNYEHRYNITAPENNDPVLIIFPKWSSKLKNSILEDKYSFSISRSALISR